MKKFFVFALFLLFVMNFTPCLAKEEDEDIFKKPQTGVIEVEDGDQVGDGDVNEPKGAHHNQDKKPEASAEKEKEPEQNDKPQVAPPVSDEVPVSEEIKGEPAQPGQGNNNHESQGKPEPVIENPTAIHEEKKNETPGAQNPPQAEKQIPEPQRPGPNTPQNGQNQPRPGNPQGRPANNPQGQPQRNPQPGQAQPQGQPQRQPLNPQPQQQQQPVKQEQKKPIEVPQTPQHEQARSQQEYVAPTNRDTEHRNIEVERINDGNRHRHDNSASREFSENEYMKLLGQDPLEYLNHYQEYSESFYNYAEGLFKEAFVPLYQQVRANPYLSMGVSFLIGLYVVIIFTRILRSLFKSKPKFRYNREETISQSDINNNFKKFLTELDTLKKQISGAAVGKGNATGEAQVVNAAIPQTLQEDLNFISQSLMKNEDTLAKVIKDKSKLDTFLMEFQREVIESHKGIWNELHQLRKVFSQMKVGGGPASAVRRVEPRDTDDTKSLSSNPEVNGQRRAEESTTRPIQKVISEPRSKSVAPGETAAMRPKPIPQKEKRPSEIETERRPSFPHQVNGGQESAKSLKEEEPQVKNQVQTPSVEKPTSQVPFGKITKEAGGEEPGIPIPTDKSSTNNPFGQGGQIGAGANGNPALPVGQKTIPFGNRAKPGMVKAPMPKTQFPQVQNPIQNPVENPVQNNSVPLESNAGQSEQVNAQENIEAKNAAFEESKTTIESENATTEVTEDTQGTNQEEINTDSTANTKPFAPVNKMGIPGAGLNRPGIAKPGIPGGKQFPAPQIRKVGMPGSNVYKGPPGNLPRPGIPTQVRPTTGVVSDGGSQGNSQV